MDEELRHRLDAQDVLLQQIYLSCEKTRRYLWWTLIITIVLFVIPLLALVLVAPMVLNAYLSALQGI